MFNAVLFVEFSTRWFYGVWGHSGSVRSPAELQVAASPQVGLTDAVVGVTSALEQGSELY